MSARNRANTRAHRSAAGVQVGRTSLYRDSVARPESPGEETQPGLPRLPPGRHGLRREFVSENQRGRLSAGIIAAVAEKGYHETTISEIATAAGVSRRTFYAYFSSKEDCFFGTYEAIAAHLRAAALEVAPAELEWTERIRAELGAVLETFAANPDLARFFLIAPSRAGSEVAARSRRVMIAALAEFTAQIPPPPAAREPSAEAEQALVGGIITLIVRKVEVGEGKELPSLLPEILELALAPFLGREEAARVARRD
jgi:AcrR family transcriptional regulator